MARYANNKTWTMPESGTAEFDALMLKWSEQPVSFPQCNKIKTMLKLAKESGALDRIASPKVRARIDHLSTRDDDGRWTYVRTDSGELTKKSAWEMIAYLDKLLAGDLKVTKVAPKVAAPAPAKNHVKATKSETIVKPAVGVYELV